MRTVAFMLGCAGLFACATASAQTDVLQVVPEKCLVAVVTKDADAAEARLRELAAKLAVKYPDVGIVEQLLQSLNLRPQPANGAAPVPPKQSQIDLKAPMAIVMVIPALDIPGFPVGFVVKTADYKKLLLELAANVGAAAPEVTPDGTDVVQGPKSKLFAAQFGQFAVIADAEYVVRTFKAEAGKGLHDANPGSIREVLQASDIAVYVNLDLLMKNYVKQIADLKATVVGQLRDAPAKPGVPMTPEKAAKLAGAEIDALVDFASQVDASVSGIVIGPGGLKLQTRVQGLPDTRLAQLAEKLKPCSPDLLRIFDSPGLLAAGWNFDPAIVKNLSEGMAAFLTKSGLIDEKEGGKELLESYRKLMASVSGCGAVFGAPATEGPGVLRLTYVLPLLPNVDIRADLRDYLQRSFRMTESIVGAVRIKSKLEAGVETYRDAALDRLTVSFEANPDAPEALKGPNATKVVESIYGPELIAWIAQVGDRLIYTVGYQKPDALKATIDRLLDSKAGTLLASDSWKAATEGLPGAHSAVVYLAGSELARVFAAPIVSAVYPDGAKLMQDFKFEKPSAAAFTLYPAPKGIVMWLNLPVQEIANLQALLAKIGEAQAAKPPPPPAPAPAPAPNP